MPACRLESQERVRAMGRERQRPASGAAAVVSGKRVREAERTARGRVRRIAAAAAVAATWGRVLAPRVTAAMVPGMETAVETVMGAERGQAPAADRAMGRSRA